MHRQFAIAVAAALLFACARESAPEAASSATTAPASSAATSEMPRAGLIYQLPANWQRVPPQSSMRLDQARVPGPAGDADLAVFFFGAGGGGSVEDNLLRWAGQVEGGAPTRDSFDVEDLKVSVIDVSGTLKPSSMGMGPQTDQPNSRLIGAVVEGPGGPWFFKLTGPQKTVAAEQAAFIRMLRSAKAAQQV